MEIINPNGVKIYNLSCGKPIPDFLSKKKRKELAKDESYRTRIELIQGYEFNSACSKIKLSKDGQYIIASGVYPPMIRCFETSQLSQKFQRNVDAEIVQVQILTEDYSKLAILQMDRNVEIHAKYGFHYKTRIPKFGRDMAYNKASCELIIGGNTNEIYRLDLEQGCFVNPFKTNCSGINKIGISDVHQLYAFGSENGILECWDPRTRHNVSSLQVFDQDISYLRYSPDGMSLALGSKEGVVKLYDLRSPTPYQSFSHQYETPITGIKFVKDFILSTDKKTVKLHNYKTNKPLVNVETPADINHIAHVPNSGLIMVACEQPKVMSYFIPELGQAPRWCSFLDNLTEEMEETKSSNFEDYKFVTRQELSQLGLDHLIGTDLLRAYMHGFFMDNRLYQRVKSVAEPFTYDEWKKSQRRKAIEEKKAQRINIRTKQPKVNQQLADHLAQNSDTSSSLLTDNRFKAMFENSEFQIDENSEEYKRLFPNGRKLDVKKDEDEELSGDVDSEGENGDEFSEDFDLLEDHDQEVDDRLAARDYAVSDSDNELMDSSDESDEGRAGKGSKPQRPRKNIKFYGLKEGGKLPQEGLTKSSYKRISSKKKQQTSLPLGERI